MSAPREFTDHFGGCPICWGSDEQLNYERANFYVCHTHRKYWSVGWNIFSSWRHESWLIWILNAKIFNTYEPCEPAHCGRPEDGGYINEVALAREGVAEAHAKSVAAFAIKKAAEPIAIEPPWPSWLP